MQFQRKFPFYRFLFFTLVCVLLGTSCRSDIRGETPVTSTNEPDVIVQNSNENQIVPATETVQPTDTPALLPAASVSPTPTATQEVTQPATATPTLLPTATLTLSPTPLATPVPCDSSNYLPDPAPFDLNVDISSSYSIIEQPYLYLATEHYIGAFGITDQMHPRFYGFWELPESITVSGLAVQHGIVYLSSGETVYVLNVSEQCPFAVIAEINLPFTIYDLKFDNEKLYIAGRIEEPYQIQVAILEVDSPREPLILNVVTLSNKPAGWSVADEMLYWIVGEKLYKADVSQPDKVEPQLIEVSLDPDLLSRSWIFLNGDSLYLFSGFELTIVHDLSSDSPVTGHYSAGHPTVSIVEVQDNFVFLGINSCDDVTCNAVLEIRDADSGALVSTSRLWPYFPIVQYIEVQDNLIYAFTEDSPLVKDALLVIDISSPGSAEVIHWVTLIT